MNKRCESCGLLARETGQCRITGRNVDPAKDYCSSHNPNPAICESCGSLIINSYFTRDAQGNWHELCGNCVSNLNRCKFCEFKGCVFDSDTTCELPKVVVQQIRQGNMIQTMQVKNPDRVRETCAVRCNCYDKEIGCRKEHGMCDNITPIFGV